MVAGLPPRPYLSILRTLSLVPCVVRGGLRDWSDNIDGAMQVGTGQIATPW